MPRRQVSYYQAPPSFTPPLDDYPGAVMAYSSTRLLRTAYAGSLIRVKRTSDDAEQDIGVVDKVLDTVSLLSFVGASDGLIEVIYDQSGNGFDRTPQTDTDANKAVIVEAGIIVEVNGYPGGKYTSVAPYILSGIPSALGNDDLEFYAVCRDEGISAGTFSMQAIYPNNTTWNPRFWTNGARQNRIRVDGSGYIQAQFMVTPPQNSIFRGTVSTSTLYLNVNGQENSRANTVGSFGGRTVTSAFIGADGSFNGTLIDLEIIVYAGQVNVGLQEDINSYYQFY